jgi:hypothetical protein
MAARVPFGRYLLIFFRFTITQIALARACAQSMREPSSWLIREKRKVRD